MSIVSCVTESTGSCKQPASAVFRDPAGRRIYINESSFTDLASHGHEEARLVYGMAARIVALKTVHQMEQDAAMLGVVPGSGALKLKETINAAWADSSSQSLRAIGYRPNSTLLRANIFQILHADEEIAASCYFSNYYTFATGARTADLMFDDTNDIATMKRLMSQTNQYDDLTMISGNCLVLMQADLGMGEGVAAAYTKCISGRTRLSAEQLIDIKTAVRAETELSVRQMIEASLCSTDEADCRSGSELLSALNFAFTRGILKNA
jgi:hypothetical protein